MRTTNDGDWALWEQETATIGRRYHWLPYREDGHVRFRGHFWYDTWLLAAAYYVLFAAVGAGGWLIYLLSPFASLGAYLAPSHPAWQPAVSAMCWMIGATGIAWLTITLAVER